MIHFPAGPSSSLNTTQLHSEHKVWLPQEACKQDMHPASGLHVLLWLLLLTHITKIIMHYTKQLHGGARLPRLQLPVHALFTVICHVHCPQSAYLHLVCHCYDAANFLISKEKKYRNLQQNSDTKNYVHAAFLQAAAHVFYMLKTITHEHMSFNQKGHR